MTWLTKYAFAKWNYLMGGLVLLLVFICGVQIGESRIQREWSAAKLRLAMVVAKQEQHAADLQQSQSQINQEILNDYTEKSKILGSRMSDLRYVGMCNSAPVCAGSLPSISESSAGAASSTTDTLSIAVGDARSMSCKQLELDAAQATLMLIEIQRWYEKQSTLNRRN